MTHPSDKALAQAFVERFERRYTPLTVRLVMEEVTARARELDAEKGGDDAERELANKDAMIYGTGFILDGKRIEPGRLQMVFMQEPVHIMPARPTPPANSGDCNRHIDTLLHEYEMGTWSAAECIPVAKRYVSTMPDSQVRCLLHILATPPAQAAESVQVASNSAPTLSKDAEAVERVARAMWQSGNYSVNWQDLFEPGKEECRRMARAAIAAMQAGEAGK